MDPRLDGVTHELPNTLDYERMVKATDLTVRWDTEGPVGQASEIAKRVSMPDLVATARRRVAETAGLYSESLDAREIVNLFTNTWSEGFVSAIVFCEQRKMTALFGPLPDKNLLGATLSIMQSWSQGTELLHEWGKRVDVPSVLHTATFRALQAVQIYQLNHSPVAVLRRVGANVWQDGFSMGLLFQELGGHRED